MSLQQLLVPETKDEWWSRLYAYSLNASNITAELIIKGALLPSIDDVKNSDIVQTIGTGTVGSSHSMFSRYLNGAAGTEEYVFGTGSFVISGYTVPQISGNQCLEIIDITLPFKIGTPGTTVYIGGASSGNVRDINVSNALSINLVNNAGKLRLEIFCFGNISGASASRTLSVMYNIHYKRTLTDEDLAPAPLMLQQGDAEAPPQSSAERAQQIKKEKKRIPRPIKKVDDEEKS